MKKSVKNSNVHEIHQGANKTVQEKYKDEKMKGLISTQHARDKLQEYEEKFAPVTSAEYMESFLNMNSEIFYKNCLAVLAPIYTFESFYSTTVKKLKGNGENKVITKFDTFNKIMLYCEIVVNSSKIISIFQKKEIIRKIAILKNNEAKEPNIMFIEVVTNINEIIKKEPNILSKNELEKLQKNIDVFKS